MPLVVGVGWMLMAFTIGGVFSYDQGHPYVPSTPPHFEDKH